MRVDSRARLGMSETLIRRWQIGLAFFAFILIGATEGGVGVLLPSIGKFYGIDKATVSLIFLSGSTGYLSAAFSSGPLVEKIGQRNLLITGVLVFLAGAILISLTPPFPILMAAWLLLGFGIATLDAGLNSYIAALPHNAVLLNYLHAFYGIGALIGPIVSSAIVISLGWGWNNTYFVWIVIAAIVLVNFWFIFDRQESVSDTSMDEQSSKSAGGVLRDALKLRAVWLGAIFLIFYVGAEVTLGNWSFTFLTEERNQAALLSGWVVSGYWLGLTLGRLTLAHLAQRIGNQRLVQGCILGVIAGVVVIWLVPVGAVAAIGLGLIGFSLGPIFPTTIALMSKIVPSRLLASAIGFLASMGSLGAAFLPWIAGNLISGLGLWTLLPYVLAAVVAMQMVWSLLPKKADEQTDPSIKPTI